MVADSQLRGNPHGARGPAHAEPVRSLTRIPPGLYQGGVPPLCIYARILPCSAASADHKSDILNPLS